MAGTTPSRKRAWKSLSVDSSLDTSQAPESMRSSPQRQDFTGQEGAIERQSGRPSSSRPTAVSAARTGRSSRRKNEPWHALRLSHHKIESIVYGDWKMTTWYDSPYPIDAMLAALNSDGAQTHRKRTASAGLAGRTSHQKELNGHAAESSSQHRFEGILYICTGCLCYMRSPSALSAHRRRQCRMRRPPGKKVWEKSGLAIWQVDAAVEKLYCQSLSLLGKLFIDHKTLFFDLGPFLFYVLTDMSYISETYVDPIPEQDDSDTALQSPKVTVNTGSSSDVPIAFFSKEKTSLENYNLAAIVVLPPFQQKGYGRLLMEFSYEIQNRQRARYRKLASSELMKRFPLGTPERPLSEMGLRGYTRFWCSMIALYLLRLFPPADTSASLSTRVITVASLSETLGFQESDILFGLGELGLLKYCLKRDHESGPQNPSSTNGIKSSKLAKGDLGNRVETSDLHGETVVITMEEVQASAARLNLRLAHFLDGGSWTE